MLVLHIKFQRSRLKGSGSFLDHSALVLLLTIWGFDGRRREKEGLESKNVFNSLGCIYNTRPSPAIYSNISSADSSACSLKTKWIVRENVVSADNEEEGKKGINKQRLKTKH